MRTRTYASARPGGAFAAAVLVMVGVALAAPESGPPLGAAAAASPLCSKIMLPPWRFEHYLLVDGTADSVRAGPGSMRVRQSSDSMELGPVPEDATIRGQRSRFIDGIGFGDRLTRLLAERGAVLVPWDYDATCRPMVWAKSPMLIEPGARALARVRPRPESEWVGGVPTFDVTEPYDWPYPRPRWAGLQSRGGDPLGPEQLFEFIRLQPTREEVEAARPAAYEPALAWVDAHPDLAARPPVVHVLPRIRRAAGER